MYAAVGTVHFDWLDHEPLDGGSTVTGSAS
jgi:hypothetical protein